MEWFIGIFIVGLFIAAFSNKSKPAHLTHDEQSQLVFSIEKPQRERIINESLEIISKTKNVDTAISRFDTIKENMQRLMDIAPLGQNLTITIHDTAFKVPSDLLLIDKFKTDWVRSFFLTKIDGEIKKANMLSDIKLQKAQLKKALNAALKSFDYMPNDGEFKGLVSKIENRLNSIEPYKGKERLR